MSADETQASPKILVIDANVFFARRLGEALKREGFEVAHSPQSAYAMTMLEWDTPSAIVCATNLREMSAHDIPRILHADIKTAHIPIIAMGEGGEQALMEAFRSGCDDYVDRRSGPEQVAAHVRAFLRSHTEGFHPTQMLENSDAALSGSLSHLDLPGVVQMLTHSRQTGALHINAGEVDGIIFFDGGEISHAERGEVVGEDAVLEIIKNCNGAESGVYKFVPGATTTTRTVLRSATELMLEALRELDEENDLAAGGNPQ
jgi:DNA-binding response OmpR family regulator